MKAVQYDRYGGPEVLEIRDVPPPLPGDGEVLVRVTAAALNPKDVLTRAGRFRGLAGPQFPKGAGYDYAGRVEAVGADMTDFRPGDAVFGMLNGWRACAAAEYLVASSDECALRPAGVSDIEAAALPLVSQTALQALRDLGGVKPGQRVAVHGASGGLGTVAVQIAKALGAEVTALCGPDSQELVRQLGADAVFDYRETPPAALPGRYDCFFDVFGNQSFWRLRRKLSLRGRYISTVPGVGSLRDHLLTRLWPGRQGLLVVVRSRRADLELIRQWVEEGRLRPVVAKVFPLDQIGAAQQQIQSKHTHGKVVLRIA